MRKFMLLGVAVLAIAVAACSGGSSSDDATTSPTPTPTGSPTATPTGTPAGNITVNVVNWPHATATFIRIIAGSNAAASAVLCRPMGPGTATMTVTSSNKLVVGQFYQAEIFSDLGGAVGVFDPAVGNMADHDYRTKSITAAAGTNTFTIDHNQQTGPNSFTDTTWAMGTACPGD